MYRLIALGLMLTACDHDCDEDTAPDADTDDLGTGDVDTDDLDSDTSSVDYPDYPSERGGTLWVGVVWLDSDGGPLGDETYIGAPNEVWIDATSAYSQTIELVPDQPNLTWNFVIPDGQVGEHYIDDARMHVYSSVDSSTDLDFTGWIRVDTFSEAEETLRMVFVGELTGETGTSSVRGAVDIAPGAE